MEHINETIGVSDQAVIDVTGNIARLKTLEPLSKSQAQQGKERSKK